MRISKEESYKLEIGDNNPTIEILQKLTKCIGVTFKILFENQPESEFTG